MLNFTLQNPVKVVFGKDTIARLAKLVPVGSRVRLKQKCLKVEPRAGGKQMTMESTIEIEGQDRPACVAETIGITYGA